MEVPAKRMRITADVWDCMLDFLTEHPEMVTGKFTVPNAKEHLSRLWKELADKLNALGCGTKTAAKWQKSFSDWKYNVKQKYSDIKTHRTKTGGGPVCHRTLTVQEERLMGLIGLSSMEGDGLVEEMGLPRQVETVRHWSEAGPSTSFASIPPHYSEVFVPSPESFEVVSEVVIPAEPPSPSPVMSVPSSSGASKTPDVSRTPTPGGNVPSFSHPRYREQSTLERFQRETMEVLRSINEDLHMISENMQRLSDAIIAYLNK